MKHGLPVVLVDSARPVGDYRDLEKGVVSSADQPRGAAVLLRARLEGEIAIGPLLARFSAFSRRLSRCLALARRHTHARPTSLPVRIAAGA